MTIIVKEAVSNFFLLFPQKTYLKGSLLILPNTAITSILYIENGIVRSYLISSKGNEVTVNFFTKQAFIPIGLAMNRSKSTYYYEAFSDITVRVTPTKKAIEFLQANPLVMYDLLQRLYRGIEGILLSKEYLIEGTAQAKIAYALLVLAKRFGKLQNEVSILIPFELDEIQIASIAGVARETVSRELRKLQQDKIISYKKRQLVITNLRFLENTLENITQIL